MHCNPLHHRMHCIPCNSQPAVEKNILHVAHVARWLSSPRRQESSRLQQQQQQPISHMASAAAAAAQLGWVRSHACSPAERVSQSGHGIHWLVLPSPGCGGKAPSSSWAALFLEAEAADWVRHPCLGCLNVDTPDDIFTGWVLSWVPKLGRPLKHQELEDLLTDKDVNGAWNAALEMAEKNGMKRSAMLPKLIPLGSAAKKKRIELSAMGHGVAPSGKPTLPRRRRGGKPHPKADPWGFSRRMLHAQGAVKIPGQGHITPSKHTGEWAGTAADQGPRGLAGARSRPCRRQPPIPL